MKKEKRTVDFVSPSAIAPACLYAPIILIVKNTSDNPQKVSLLAFEKNNSSIIIESCTTDMTINKLKEIINSRSINVGKTMIVVPDNGRLEDVFMPIRPEIILTGTTIKKIIPTLDPYQNQTDRVIDVGEYSLHKKVSFAFEMKGWSRVVFRFYLINK